MDNNSLAEQQAYFSQSRGTLLKHVPDVEDNSPKKNFARDLAQVQLRIGNAIKDAKNDYFSNKYATLASVWDAWQKIGPEFGFAVVQILHDPGERQGVLIETKLLHKCGHEISSVSFMPTAKPKDPQACGSAITYGRRYALAALVGICPDDDDGNAASGNNANTVKRAPGGGGSSFAASIDKAMKAHWDNPDKLRQISMEALKAGLSGLTDKMSRRIEEIEKGNK